MGKVEILNSLDNVNTEIELKPTKRKAPKKKNTGKEFESKINVMNK